MGNSAVLMTQLTDLVSGLIEKLGDIRTLADTAGVSLDNTVYIADITCAQSASGISIGLPTGSAA